jgi:hypothetical protein
MWRGSESHIPPGRPVDTRRRTHPAWTFGRSGVGYATSEQDFPRSADRPEITTEIHTGDFWHPDCVWSREPIHARERRHTAARRSATQDAVRLTRDFMGPPVRRHQTGPQSPCPPPSAAVIGRPHGLSHPGWEGGRRATRATVFRGQTPCHVRIYAGFPTTSAAPARHPTDKDQGLRRSGAPACRRAEALRRTAPPALHRTRYTSQGNRGLASRGSPGVKSEIRETCEDSSGNRRVV